MDIQRHTRPTSWFSKYKMPVLLGLGCSALILAAVFIQPSGYYADAQNLAVGEVKQGRFEVNVRGNGVLVPQHVRWLAANVAGRVEAIHVKAGAKVKPGDLIIQLSNPALVKQAEEIRWELEAKQAENQALVVSLASQLLDQQAKVQNAKMNYDSAKIQLDAEKSLLEEGNATVSKIDYQRSVLSTDQYYARWQIEQQRQAKLEELRVAEIHASEARLNKLRKTLARAEEQVASLDIRASLEGVLQAMPLEPGQQVNLGDNIAKLARQDALIAEINIPERQIRDVTLGQSVVIDTRLSKVRGEVTRIDPAVVNGTVQVDVAFVDELPGEARPDLTVSGTIQVAELANTLFVGRPTFAQSQSITSVYLVSADGSWAEKTSVQFGIGSSGEIQILAGLSAGQRIILSDHSAWEHLDRISIN